MLEALSGSIGTDSQYLCGIKRIVTGFQERL
jgi:hypothetical protein